MLSDDKNSPRRRYGYGWYGNAAAVAGGQERDAGRCADASAAAAPSEVAQPDHDHPKTLPHDADWWAVDGAICALGTTRAKTPSAAAYRAIDHDYALAIATLVRKHGAARFALTSSMGADMHSPFRYTRTKGELEDAIIRLGFRR
jgi:uncharacterized protein YbjT (DUF2867 family)